MKLQSKLTLFSAASKIIILLLLIFLLPLLVHRVALHNTDTRLLEKKEQVFDIIEQQGIESFVSNSTGAMYGSYNLLKEEFISIEPIDTSQIDNRIENSYRKVEGEILEYRVLSLAFAVDGGTYLLEIGRSLDTIRETSGTMQQYASYFLVAVVLITVFIDLAFVKVLLRPLTLIIRRLERIGHPETFKPNTLGTSTSDFVYLNDTINSMMVQTQQAFLKEKEFIGNVSHELLTPVSILQTRLENLLSDPQTPEDMLVKLVESQRTLHRLKSIIQALLLISRIENEQYLRNEEVSLETLAQEIAEEVEERLEVKRLTLELHLAQDAVLKGNHSLLFTMLFNVVNNAIKYNRPGGAITIEGRQLEKGYQLSVQDTGVGIAKEQISHIFNRFKRLQAPDGESHGLGLSIVQTVAKFHGVKLSIDSQPGKGTCFSFLFPVSSTATRRRDHRAPVAALAE
ncbi:signal transduction histidine kinase [Pontibacter ummariensis]|uniref:histidine kinase n=1 Tax=Pontibacter ummariensis TaxID=1610492 RepID=A0A239GMF6_9BACT|nr:HAMP domain-containing sensor histidine kinase [Pontibacter ummariensis]PRY11349.1 signal transduction histidine kinase [Pontibacter ummariensis]SNS70456.1 Signal transduction histidine kinase [Pontibacter ummariensis]